MLHFHFQLANRATHSLYHKGLQPKGDSLAPENTSLGLVDRVFAKISFLQKIDIISTFIKKILKNRGVEIGGFCLLEMSDTCFTIQSSNAPIASSYRAPMT
jgi:hypothetical protein